MSIFNDASFDNASVSGFNRHKFQAGRHVCKVTNIREVNGFKGYTFLIDLEGVESATDQGLQTSMVFQPFNPPPPGSRMPPQTLKEKEFGKIKQAVGAIFGLNDPNAIKAQITTAVLSKAVGANGAVSPLAGRLVVLNAKPYTNKMGSQTVIYELLPHLVNGQLVDTDGVPANTNAAPVVPVPPPAPTSQELPRFPHPQMPGFTYDASGAIFSADGKKIN